MKHGLEWPGLSDQVVAQPCSAVPLITEAALTCAPHQANLVHCCPSSRSPRLKLERPASGAPPGLLQKRNLASSRSILGERPHIRAPPHAIGVRFGAWGRGDTESRAFREGIGSQDSRVTGQILGRRSRWALHLQRIGRQDRSHRHRSEVGIRQLCYMDRRRKAVRT